MSIRKNTHEQNDFVWKLIVSSTIPRDSLPYHAEFDRLYNQYRQSGLPKQTKAEFWQLILRCTKRGKSSQPDAKSLPAVARTEDEAFAVIALLPDTPGARDRLPYTREFDAICKQFNSHFRRHLSKNEFWRLLSGVTKRSRKPKAVLINPDNRLPDELVRSLVTANPWWSGNSMREIKIWRRPIYSRILEGLLKQTGPRIHLLRGPRQVGKSTLQEQMIFDLLFHNKQSVSSEQIFRILVDDVKIYPLEQHIKSLLNWFELNVVKDTFNNMSKKGKPVYIFLDEFQEVDSPGLQLKNIVDAQDCHIFATGSSSLKIGNCAKDLPGRAKWHELSTLSLSEIAQFKGLGNLSPYTKGNHFADWREKEFWIGLAGHCDQPLLLDEVFHLFCDFGGYPFCHEHDHWDEAEDFLRKQVVSRTIEHDLQSKHQWDASTLEKLFYLLCKYTGRDVHLSLLHRELKEGYSVNLTHEKIRSGLDFFADSMLVSIFKPSEHRLKNSQERVKICLGDHAIRRALMNELIPLYGTNVNSDLAGPIVEGIVGSRLASCYPRDSLPGNSISYLPDTKDEGSEVDFILSIGEQHIPIEVKYRNRAKPSTGILQYLEQPQHNAPFGLLITKDEERVKDNLIAIPLKKFLLLK
jgi:predicted AAA+ superfamily ATPase